MKSGAIAYLDTSAYLKIVLAEAESPALRDALASEPLLASSELLAAEGVRACGRYGGRYADAARKGLAGLALIPLSRDLLDEAAELEPAPLRTLDAIHLASAARLGSRLTAFYGYDRRLCAAARDRGWTVRAPA